MMWRRDRRAMTSLMSPSAQVLLWVVVSLLPLVGGAGTGPGRAGTGVEPDPGRALGLRGGQEERELPVTLPEVVEEEREDNGDPYPIWHTFYDPYVMEEADDHPSSRWAGRFPRSSSSSDTSEPPPRGAPKKKKRRKKEKEGETEKGRIERSKGRGKAGRAPKQSDPDCRVERREMKVRDLGLGFDSDEIVVFKFCVGSCRSSRTNYDLALKVLLNGSLPRRTARKVSIQPCCRPDRYESVSFMDAQTTWRTIQSLSAVSCMCMG